MDEMNSAQEVTEQRQDLEYRVDAFLRRAGWEHTSSTPGSYWMWQREINGQKLLVDKEHALSIQAHLEAEADADEPGDE